MTNEEKAKQLTMCDVCSVVCNNDCLSYQKLIEMAEWKEKEVVLKLKEFMKHHFEENITPLGKTIETLHFDTIEDVANEFTKCLNN